jgi:hypothetical protein
VEPKGKIVITVTDTEVIYVSEFSTPEVVFWLDVVKAMIVDNVAAGSGGR